MITRSFMSCSSCNDILVTWCRCTRSLEIIKFVWIRFTVLRAWLESRFTTWHFPNKILVTTSEWMICRSQTRITHFKFVFFKQILEHHFLDHESALDPEPRFRINFAMRNPSWQPCGPQKGTLILVFEPCKSISFDKNSTILAIFRLG